MFAVVLFFILLIVILTFKSSVNRHLDKLSREIDLLREDLAKKQKQEGAPPVKAPVTVAAPVQKQKEYWESSFTPVEEPAQERQAEPAIDTTKKEPAEMPGIPQKPTAPVPAFVPPAVKVYEPAPPSPGFFERHPDLEKFIGENLINKIGIAILVLAIGFFVKYAIDNNWIGPVGRVGIGILCGGILTALAHRLRKNYKAFSSVLVGGGLAIFYFTIALAYHQFHLFGQVASFIIMIVITAFAVLLSILHDRQELAIIALLGGFATPFMVSNGSGDYKTLFTYLLVLNTGLLVMAYNKAWRLLNLLSFIFTVLLFGTWITQIPGNASTIIYKHGLLFGTVFYLLFFTINIANNIRENRKFIASDFGILLANTSLYFAAGLYFISMMQADNYRGLFSAAMGVFNLAASYGLFRKQKVDRNILYLLIGITLTFVSLTAPLQLHGNYITLFWASEAVLLYWLHQRSGIGIIRFSSFIIWIAMLVSLLMDWFTIYNSSNALAFVFNKGMITGLYAAAASYGLFMLVKKDTVLVKESWLRPNAYLFGIAGLLVLFTAGLLEINYQFLYYYPNTAINVQYVLLYTYLFVLLFSLLTQKITAQKTNWQISAVLIAICLFLYLFSIQGSFGLLYQMLTEKKYAGHFSAHRVAAVIIAVLFFMLTKLAQKHFTDSANIGFIAWILCGWAVVFLSTETYLLSNQLYYTDAANWRHTGSIFEKTALPILWGLCSFAFMWLGMRHKFRTLRIVSLVLFTITLVKLFVFDIRNIPAAGKIAAFFCLGVLLLVVSFMYQRLKRIIIEDEKKAEA